jgi:hypothetical protein
MIDLIYRSKAPAYKGATPTTNNRAGLLSGLWCYLFGGGSAPAYRGTNTNGATAPVPSRCWWSFAGSPRYKAPPPVASDPDQAAPPDEGEPTGEDCAGAGPVVTREIHIYPQD